MINQKIRDLFKNFYFLFFLSFILWMTIIDSNGFINRYRLSKKLSELNTQKEFYVKEINKVTLDKEKFEVMSFFNYGTKRDLPSSSGLTIVRKK